MHQLPMIKEIYPVYNIDSDRIRLGAEVGVTTELTDNDGRIRCLIDLLDGSRNIRQITSDIQQQYPDVTEKDVQSVVTALDEYGFIEDAQKPGSDILTEEELIRYQCNINYFSAFTGLNDDKHTIQESLRDSRVTLLGLGGGGSTILWQLAGLGIGHITLVDLDTVEMKNLNRQILYSERDIGKPKVEIAARRIGEFNPQIHVEPIQERIESVEDVQNVATNSDLVICLIDEPHVQVQRWVNEAITYMNIPCLFGVSHITKSRWYSVIPEQTGCHDCLILHYLRETKEFEKQARSVIQAQRENHLQSAPLAPNFFMLTGIIASDALALLTHIKDPLSPGRMMELDYLSMTTYPLTEWEEYDDCPCCGHGSYGKSSIFAMFDELGRPQERELHAMV